MDVLSERALADRLALLDGTEPRVVVGGNFSTPWRLVELADSVLSSWRAFVLNPQPAWPHRDGFTMETPFVGPGVRDGRSFEYLPMRLSLAPRLFRTSRPPDAVFVQTSPPRNGMVSLGVEVNILPSAIEQVRERGGLVVAQLNEAMPYTYGDAEVSVEHVDLAIEGGGVLPSPGPRPPDPAAEEVGHRVAAYAEDGATVQLGIGALPEAATRSLQRFNALRVWSEMVSDGVLELERKGSLDANAPIATSFLFGSPELYEWADDNRRLRLLRTETINNPATIASHRAMLSINTALTVDLFAQANASHVGGRLYSGFGGQPDFVVGALHAPRGHAIIALHAWHDKSATSNVVPILTSPATSFQHSVIVTQFGAAELFGQEATTQARRLMEVADPRARGELETAWSGFEAAAAPRGRRLS